MPLPDYHRILQQIEALQNSRAEDIDEDLSYEDEDEEDEEDEEMDESEGPRQRQAQQIQKYNEDSSNNN